jgi:PhnB protein
VNHRRQQQQRKGLVGRGASVSALSRTLSRVGHRIQGEKKLPVLLNPYLSFRENARQAMEFYQSVFGGDLTLSTFAEFGASADPAEQDKIMHGFLQTDSGMALMGADTPNNQEYQPVSGISVSLSGDDEAELRRYWDALSQNGTISLPLEQAPWGDSFGMCTDQFGVSWMVNIAGTQP